MSLDKPSMTILPGEQRMSVTGTPVKPPNMLSVSKRPAGATGPAPFKIHDGPMELCRAYMRQRAWMVARAKGLAFQTTEERIEHTLDLLFEETNPPESKPIALAPPAKPVGPEPRTIREGLEWMNTIEVTNEVSEKNVLMWKKLYMHSLFLLVIVNIFTIIFSPSWPIGIVPFFILVYTFFKWRKADDKYFQAQKEERQRKMEQLFSGREELKGRGTVRITK